MSNMQITYTVKITIVNTIKNEYVSFIKNFTSDINTDSDKLLYDNNHILHDAVYLLDLFPQEISDYCEAKEITTANIEIDEYEINTITERAEVYFENPDDPNVFTLSPCIKCYVYPKEEELKVPTLIGEAVDSNTIIWTWPNDEAYMHYLVTEPLDVNEDVNTSEKIIATIPIGATQYIETGLEPNTPYTRRLINYTATQTSLPSGPTTITTETVNPTYSLSEYFINREQDWTITDKEREFVQENLEAFHSGVGDLLDCKVYKQSDTDFYEKFKGYFVLSGTYTKREKRYEQVNFRYKLLLDAMETIEEQEGYIDFKLDVYPWQEVYCTEYLWATMPVNVYAKVHGSIMVFKETTSTYEDDVEIDVVTLETKHSPFTIIISIDCSSSMTMKDPGQSDDRITIVKKAICDALSDLVVSSNPDAYQDGIDDVHIYVQCWSGNKHYDGPDADDGNNYYERSFTQTKKAYTNIMDAINFVDGFKASGSRVLANDTTMNALTNWNLAFTKLNNRIATGKVADGKLAVFFFSDGAPLCANDKTFHNSPKYVNYLNGELSNKVGDTTYYYSSNYNSPGISRSGVDYYGAYLVAKAIDDGYESQDSTYVSNTQATDAIQYVQSKVPNIDYGEQKSKTTVAEDISASLPDALKGALQFTYEKHNKITVKAEVPVTDIDAKYINLESELLKFTFDGSKTPVKYNTITKKAEIYKTLDPTKMVTANGGTIKSVKQLLEDALVKALAKPENAGYKTGNVKDGNGNPVGKIFKNLHVKDTYGFADEDDNDITSLDFSGGWQYGKMGSINTYTNLSNITTADHSDDRAVVTDDSYVWIDGYTEGIIYDGVRYGHANVCKYVIPQVTMFFKNDVKNILKNRLAETLTYGAAGGPVDSSHVFKEVWLMKTPDPNYTQLFGNGIDEDMIVKIDKVWSSPRLDYRFNLEDPNAYTPYYELLPDCNPQSDDKHCVVITVYKAENVFVNSKTGSDNYISSFDYEDPVQSPKLYEYGLHSTWDANEGIYDCDGHYINQWLHFQSAPMLKTQEYHDQLPPEDQELYYGMVNGRYRENNPTGKQDLRVETPKFNIPTTVLAKHADTVKIYIEVTEVSTPDALVEYEWKNEYPIGSGYTKVNGDYVTFTCDSPTMMDIEYKDTVSTYQTETMELFDQKPFEIIKQFERPIFDNEPDFINHYNFENTMNWQVDCIQYEDTGIEILPNGLLFGPKEDIRPGRFIINIKGINLLNTTLEIKNKEDSVIEYETEKYDDEEILLRFTIWQRHDDVMINIVNTSSEESVYIADYQFGRTSGYYEHYYLEASTNNGDVMVARCPSEITFDDNNTCEVPVTYQGVVNATSQWAPRIHNGYYYFNQHEHYIYSEFDVKADFEQTALTNYNTETVFITFKVNLWKDGGPLEQYSLNKDSKVELLQDEANFVWVEPTPENPDLYGVTLKPTITGFEYKHYEATTWTSPPISFQNCLTADGELTIDYINTDGSNEGLNFYIRYYDFENGCWQDWNKAVAFINGMKPSDCGIPLSPGYQVRTQLSATEVHTEYEWDDYLCCYLDWCDYLDENTCKNINTSTDHISVGPLKYDGMAVSKILDFGCKTGITLSMFASKSTASIQVAYSNNRNDLILENAQWQDASVANTSMKYRFWRFKIEIPYKVNVYWVHIGVKTLKTDVVLPYIRQITMTGEYLPEDIEAYIQNLESFEIPADGTAHKIIDTIGNFVDADIVEKGFTRDNITKVEIVNTNPRCYLIYDNGLTAENPDPALLDTPVLAAVDEAKIETLTNTPYIKVNNNQIVITGTPQQYCPITVETVDGVSLKQIYDASKTTMKLSELITITNVRNYIELKRTDFEEATLKIWVNDDAVTDYEIVNHLIFFKDNLNENDVVSVSYNVLNSFYAEIDRENNTTIIIPYENKEEWSKANKKFKVMFETSLTNNKYKTNLSMNPIYRTDYEGFIYATYEHNEPYKIRIFCTTKRLKHGGQENCDINIEVVDMLDNPVINKEVDIDCLYGTLDYDKLTTDDNGVVHLVYTSCYNICTDVFTVKVLNDTTQTNLEESIKIAIY